jgi:hypothetical protein
MFGESKLVKNSERKKERKKHDTRVSDILSVVTVAQKMMEQMMLKCRKQKVMESYRL